MKSIIRLYAAAILVGLSAICTLVIAGQNPSSDGKSNEPVDIRTALEKGQASGTLPEGMVVRIGACLGEADAKASEKREPEELMETWEFTSKQIHRVVLEFKDNKSSYLRVESRPFDSKDICKNLLDGKAIDIQASKGVGPEIGFVGTHYHRGSRSIEVELNGQSVLDLHETNGPVLVLYHETDARAFGALYERLAVQARMAFKSKPGEAR